MRIVGVILVALAAMALGWEGFTYVTTEKVGDGTEVTRERENTVWVPPLVSGIALVSGLILLASTSRREEG